MRSQAHQGAHAGLPLRQDGIVGHRPTYGTMQNGRNMIGIDRPQLGHNMLAHGSAVGVGPDADSLSYDRAILSAAARVESVPL